MKRQPIYVEIDIDTEMDTLWEATQNPQLHEQWDLRFSSITYLPKKENEPQPFTYKRSLGFGLEIEGWGISTGTHNGKNGERTSSLHFGTDNPISPIKEGRGYWKYVPKDNSINFFTQYNYDSNFGKFGEVFDSLIFRPLIGWGTALSFDVLKKWIETEETPASQYMRFFLTWTISYLFSFIWIYHGLVPKLLFLHKDEVNMVNQLLAWSSITASSVVITVGIIEIVIGLCWLFYRNKRMLFLIQLIVFPILMISAIVADSSSLSHPFNPITFNISLFILSLVGFFMSKNLPTATTCKRKREK